MSFRSLVIRATLGVAVLAPSLAAAFSGGPAAAKIKTCSPIAPTPGACTDCHASAGGSNPRVELFIAQMGAAPVLRTGVSGPVNRSYTPGATYDFILRATELSPARCAHATPINLTCTPSITVPIDFCDFGFQMTAVLANSCGAAMPRMAGQFVPTTSTQIVCGPGSGPATPACSAIGQTTEYIEHRCGSTVGVTAERHEWMFQWQAPAAQTPPATPVLVYFGVNFANGNARNTGDAPVFSADVSDLQLILTEGTTAGTCDLLRASVASLTPPIDKAGTLFSDTTSCPGKMLPATVDQSDFGATPTKDVDPISGGDPLIVYQAEHTLCNGCSGTLLVRKNGLQVQVLLQ